MTEKILVPILGESITEATVAKWLKNKGDNVLADEPIIELETDKVNLEVPSPINGILAEINVKDGDVVEVGALLGLINEGSVNSTVKEIKKIKPTNEINNVVSLDIEKKEPIIFDKEKKEEEKPLVLTNELTEKPLVLNKKKNENLSPAVRKISVENNIDTSRVSGSGKDGRILKGDLISKMGVSSKPSDRKTKYGQEERIKMTRLRQTIAKR